MSDKISGLCYKTSDKIIDILDGLGYSNEKKPSYENELRDLVAIEVRRNINEVVTVFYNSEAVMPIVPLEQTNDEIKKSLDEETNSKTENQ